MAKQNNTPCCAAPIAIQQALGLMPIVETHETVDNELREDGGFILREDGGYVLRES